MRPLDILHDSTARTLTVTWEDGERSTYEIHYLRGWCPCATCQGHSNVVRYQACDENIALESMWEVGAYAVGLRFSDGHDKGIFHWRWLRAIRPAAPPRGLKTGQFIGERYVAND